MKAEPFKPVDFQLANGSVIQVCLDTDTNEVNVRLYGLRCGELVVIARAGNAIRLQSNGRGVTNDETET